MKLGASGGGGSSSDTVDFQVAEVEDTSIGLADLLPAGEMRQLFVNHLLPMFPGATLEPEIEPARGRQNVILVSPSVVDFAPDGTWTYRYRLRRTQPFDAAEVEVVRHFMGALLELLPAANQPYFTRLLSGLAERVVAGAVRPRRVGEDLVALIISRLSQWASQTYENSRISCAIGIDPQASGPDVSNVHFREASQREFAKVLSNGLDTILVVSASGHISGYTALHPPPLRELRPQSRVVYAPVRFSAFARWARRGRIAVVLNRNGEILVLANQRLRFARRRGNWYHFTHESSIARLGRVGTKELRESLYETCLDVSFARTGGLLVLMKSGRARLFNDLVKTPDVLRKRASEKTEMLDHCLGKPFNALPRLVRREIAALDGATVIGHDGELVAAGAIVSVPGGSEGGGRLAAAKALSRLGCAIKVSADGGIVAFSDRGLPESPEQAFGICLDPRE
jgi:hypothetical protein